MPLPVLKTTGLRSVPTGALYSDTAPKLAETPITLIPYLAWANREPGEMLVWLLEK
mgnify:CR=1 FL=1